MVNAHELSAKATHKEEKEQSQARLLVAFARLSSPTEDVATCTGRTHIHVRKILRRKLELFCEVPPAICNASNHGTRATDGLFAPSSTSGHSSSEVARSLRDTVPHSVGANTVLHPHCFPRWRGVLHLVKRVDGRQPLDKTERSYPFRVQVPRGLILVSMSIYTDDPQNQFGLANDKRASEAQSEMHVIKVIVCVLPRRRLYQYRELYEN